METRRLQRETSGQRLIDLFVVSVLLDAGAGDKWKFVEPGSGQSTPEVKVSQWRVCICSWKALFDDRRCDHMVDGELFCRRFTANKTDCF